MFNPNDYVPKSSISKILSPGNHAVRLRNMMVQPGKTRPEEYHIKLLLEGPPITDPDFEGMAFDRQNPSEGSYEGQIATVKMSNFPYKTWDYKDKHYERDEDIYRAVMNFAQHIGKLTDVQTKVGDINTIEEFVDAVASVLSDPNYYFWVTLAGEESLYQDKVSINLHFPKYDTTLKTGSYGVFNSEEPTVIPKNVTVYDSIKHFTTLAQAESRRNGGNGSSAQAVAGFEGQATTSFDQPVFGTQAPIQTPAPAPLAAAPAPAQPVQQRQQPVLQPAQPARTGADVWANTSAGDDDLPFKAGAGAIHPSPAPTNVPDATPSQEYVLLP